VGWNEEVDPMRLLVLAALAALTLAGQAASQPASDHDGGGSVVDYPFPGTLDNATSSKSYSPAAEALYRQMHFACEADQKTLCASKTGRAIGQCLRDHTKVVSPPCKAAIVQARRADQGKL
jgi:hypothetical protein